MSVRAHSLPGLNRRKLLKRVRCWSSRRYWREIHQQQAGRRGFVIGNGPSLRMTDLDRLQGEVCLAANRIYLAFDQTRWRPDYVTVADAVLWPKIREEIGQHIPTLHAVADLDPAPGVAMHYYAYRGRADDHPESPAVPPAYSANVLEGIVGGYTVTFDNLQLAEHLGLNPIYLLGCDHFYAGESGQEDEGQAIRNVSTQNHFSPNYRDVGEPVNPAPIAQMNRAFREAQRYAQANGRTIANATRGGHLDIFPRVDFDALFR